MKRVAQRRRKGTHPRKRKGARKRGRFARAFLFPRNAASAPKRAVLRPRLKPPYEGTWFVQTAERGLWHPIEVSASGKLRMSPYHIKFAADARHVCMRMR